MGEVFAGRYELADPIGRGGVGAVWRAWDHRRRRYVAAKVLQQSDAHSLLRFVREQALRIDHPHVLAPASWAADDDKVLFTMDLVAGGSLAHLVGDYGPLPAPFVCTLLDQLLSGLAAVHAEDVVHRDIKPANILLEATGTGRPRLRLSDFGIAMRLGEPRLTETNLVVGTPGYLAPEQMMGAEPDFAADLFAVGLVALYLLEGAKPDAKALIQYFAEHGTPGAPKGIPEPLWQVVATLLQPDPLARFRTATGARKALASAAELLPEAGPDDELIEIFDQIGPLPPGFGPDGPLKPARGVEPPSGGPGSAAERGEADSVPNSSDTSSGSNGSGTGSVPTGAGAAVVRADLRQETDPRQVSDPQRQADGPGQGTDPRQPTGSQPPSMSDTGSFHLPPPQPTGSSPRPQHAAAPTQRQPEPQPSAPAQQHPELHQYPYSHSQPQHHPQAAEDSHPGPAPFSPYESTHVLSSPQPHTPRHSTQALTPVSHQRAEASTASYTAQDGQVPPSAQAISQPRHRAARPPRRPGPPAKVAVPLLLLALACYAVGFWALTRI